jgi:hypothetical protein
MPLGLTFAPGKHGEAAEAAIAELVEASCEP